ncbi:hypothetical protein BRC90_08450 [Halobacteriales archaeon QS_4_69_34]|nr:MAG: hypothetical protein BRC90_08450 [Halobacteriales archaeon QS_4_69_34]
MRTRNAVGVALAVAVLVVPAGVAVAALPADVGGATTAERIGDGPSAGSIGAVGGVGSVGAAGAVGATGSAGSAIGTAGQPRADPAEDTLGWEDGYWHDEAIDVDQSDGLSRDEREAYVARAKARIEYLREHEFTIDVTVEVLTREEYRSRQGSSDDGGTSPADEWRNQLWEALFVVNESRNVSEEFDAIRGAAVQGYYAPGENELVVVSEGGETVIDNRTLVHELTHALQDQEFDLGATYDRRTRDGALAARGLTEGDPNYVEARYVERCGVEWTCVRTPAEDGGSGDDGGTEALNRGIYATIVQPYSDGPALIDRLLDRGGWAAVDAAYERPPISTEQTIHPEAYPDERPASLRVADTARDGWTRYEVGDGGANTLGEASIYAMLWYQGTAYDNPVIDTDGFHRADGGPFDSYNYTSAPSSGWAGDRVVPYGNGDERGYVWTTRWDSAADAREFETAYRAVLDGHGAERVDAYTWTIPGGGYADAFRVVRTGRTVTITNGPTVAALDDVRPVAPVDGDLPRDPDGDSLYEDVNGDGTFDVVDVQALFADRDDDTVVAHGSAFDYNDDGAFDVSDVQALFAALSADR